MVNRDAGSGEVFPHQAKWVDEMAFLMAMSSKTNVHGPGTYMMKQWVPPAWVSLPRAWTSYALGNLSDNLPTFVVLPDSKGLPYNQRGPFSAGFLPAIHQGTVINTNPNSSIPDLFPKEQFDFANHKAAQDGLALLHRMNREYQVDRSHDSELESRMLSYELAAKMQLWLPKLLTSAVSHKSPIKPMVPGIRLPEILVGDVF